MAERKKLCMMPPPVKEEEDMLSAIDKWDTELRDIRLTNPSFMSDDDEKLVAIKSMMPTKIKEYVDIHGQTMSYAEVRLTMDWAVNKKIGIAKDDGCHRNGPERRNSSGNGHDGRRR